MSRDADTEAVVVRGTLLTVEYAIRSDGSMLAKTFIESLDESDQRKLATLFKRLADHGTVPNREQFKKVRNEIFEFKKHQIRVFCFREGNSWVLTNGYRKKKDRLDQAEIDRAERIRVEHLARKRPRGREN